MIKFSKGVEAHGCANVAGGRKPGATNGQGSEIYTKA